MVGLIYHSKVEDKSADSGGSEVWELISPDRCSLIRLKRLSIRNKSWFTKLSWMQRRFVDAVITTLDRIRSLLLLRLLAPLIRDLLTAICGDARKGALALMGEGAYRMMKKVAERIVQIAKNWGNKKAHTWLNGRFVRYLTIMSLPQNQNTPLFSINGCFDS